MMLGLAIVMAAGVPMPVGAAPDVAVRDGLIRTFAKPSGAGQVLRQMTPPPLGPVLARFTPNRFLEHRQELMGALYVLRDGLISAIRPTPKEMDLLIDLAALHLSQRMLPEARSFLDALPEAVGPSGGGGARMTAAQEGRARSIGAALDGFSDVEASVPAGWPDAPLFEALQHITRKEYIAARPLLGKAVAILDAYPPALADRAFPKLFLAAIESGAWDVARDLAERLRVDDDSNHSAAYRYLLGRAAELGGDYVAALDNHAAAAAGTDDWAQLSRLALIDLGRVTATLPAEDARQLLTQTRTLWSGGALGLTPLQRLAGLELSERRDLPALDVLADIIRRHPDTREAEAAAEKAHALIEEIYARGLMGGMPLADLLDAHRAIAHDYRFDVAFDAFAESFADHLAASGASSLAAAEFKELRDRIDARAKASEDDTTAAQVLTRDRLRLKHASALRQGGRLDEAETLLAAPVTAPDPALQDHYNLMRAQLFAAMNRPADVLATEMSTPSIDYLRLRAEAAFGLGNWDAARETYEQLLERLGSGLRPGDRINLLLATHRGSDPDRLHDLTLSFPELGENWAALAAGLTAEAPEVLPLRGDAARERVENAESALRLLQAAGGGDMP